MQPFRTIKVDGDSLSIHDKSLSTFRNSVTLRSRHSSVSPSRLSHLPRSTNRTIDPAMSPLKLFMQELEDFENKDDFFYKAKTTHSIKLTKSVQVS